MQERRVKSCRGRSGGRTVTRLCLTFQRSSLAGFLVDLGDSRLICRRCRYRQSFRIAWTTRLLPIWVRPGRSQALRPGPLSPHRLSWTLFRSKWIPMSWRTRHCPMYTDRSRGRLWELSPISRSIWLVVWVVALRVLSLAGGCPRRAPSLRNDLHRYSVVLVSGAHSGTRHIVPRTMRRHLASLAFLCTNPDSWNGLASRSWLVCWRWDRGGGYIRWLGIRLWMRLSSCIGRFVWWRRIWTSWISMPSRCRARRQKCWSWALTPVVFPRRK